MLISDSNTRPKGTLIKRPPSLFHFFPTPQQNFQSRNFREQLQHLNNKIKFLSNYSWRYPLTFFKFSRGETKGSSRNILFKTCGILVWSAILALAIYFLFDWNIENFVFWLEPLAVVSFGISWSIKGEAMEDIMGLFRKP